MNSTELASNPSSPSPEVQAGIDVITRARYGAEYLNATKYLAANAARAQRAPIPAPTGFTVRDEANALVAVAFRNGFLESLHDGSVEFSDGAMRKLMIETTAKLAELLFLARARPDLYAALLSVERERWCRQWEREAGHAEIIPIVPTKCSECGAGIRTGWRFCDQCHARQKPLADVAPPPDTSHDTTAANNSR